MNMIATVATKEKAWQLTDKLLQYVSDKRKSAELHERQKYNYYCDRQAGCWNWTKEQDEAYQKEWDDIIVQMHTLKDLENAMNLMNIPDGVDDLPFT